MTECNDAADNILFSKEFKFHDEAISEAAGAKGFIRLPDDTWMGRFWKCEGNVEVVIWDFGNGWADIHEVIGDPEDVESFWENIEQICRRSMECNESLLAA